MGLVYRPSDGVVEEGSLMSETYGDVLPEELQTCSIQPCTYVYISADRPPHLMQDEELT